MESKLAGLIDRLESVVQRAESVNGGASAPAQTAAPAGAVNPIVKAWQMDVMSKSKAFLDAANALNIAQVTKASNQYVSLLNLQTATQATMAKFSKPSNAGFMSVKSREICDNLSLVK